MAEKQHVLLTPKHPFLVGFALYFLNTLNFQGYK